MAAKLALRLTAHVADVPANCHSWGHCGKLKAPKGRTLINLDLPRVQ